MALGGGIAAQAPAASTRCAAVCFQSPAGKSLGRSRPSSSADALINCITRCEPVLSVCAMTGATSFHPFGGTMCAL